MEQFLNRLFELLQNVSKHFPEDEWHFERDMVDMDDVKEALGDIGYEYKNATLCFLGSPCEYQTEEANINHGWIPCSERLPSPFENVQVTHLGFHDNQPHSEGKTAFMDETGCWKWTYGSNIVCVPIIAWRENLPPYQPKASN